MKCIRLVRSTPLIMSLRALGVFVVLLSAPAQAQKINLPPVTRANWENGARVVLMEYHKAPTLTVTVVFPGGSAADAADKAGAASMTTSLLRRGTEKRTAPQIAEQIDFLGGSLDGSVDDDLPTVRQLLSTGFFFGDSIRVLALEPGVDGNAVEANLARYDTVLRGVLGWNTSDNVTGSSAAFRNGNFGVGGVSLEKALPTGGLTNITLGDPTNQGITPGTNIFSNFSQRNVFSGGLTPQWAPNLTVGFQQPL